MALGRLRWVAFGFVVLFFVVTVVLPAVMLIQVSFIRFIGLEVFDPASYTLDNWRRMLTLRVNRLALTNSLVMSIVATTVRHDHLLARVLRGHPEPLQGPPAARPGRLGARGRCRPSFSGSGSCGPCCSRRWPFSTARSRS